MTRNTGPPVGSSKSSPDSTGTESVADILEQELKPTIHEWLKLVEKEPDLIRIPLNFEERTGHLPKLLHEVIARLRGVLPLQQARNGQQRALAVAKPRGD